MTEPHTKLGERSLSDDQVERLAELVCHGLKELGDCDIRAPHPRDFLAEHHMVLGVVFELSVDIDVGSTVLTVRLEQPWDGPSLSSGTNIAELADGICYQVGLVQIDENALERLRALEASAKAKIKRDRLPLKLLSVRLAPLKICRSKLLYYQRVWLQVELLDDLLFPYAHYIIGDSPRAICQELKDLGQKQTVRLAARQRLTAQDAILEIDATAEHAIRATGHNVGSFVRRMIDTRNSRQSPIAVEIWWSEEEDEDRVSIYALNGRISLEARLGPLRWDRWFGIRVDRVFAQCVTSALIGRPLCALIEHPFLLGSTAISEAEIWGKSQTKLSVLDPVRPIMQNELLTDARWGQDSLIRTRR